MGNATPGADSAGVGQPPTERTSAGCRGDEEHLRVGDIAVFPPRYRVEVAGVAIAATPAEVRVLARLSRRPGWAVSPRELHEAAGSRAAGDPTAAVRTLVHRLRGRLGPAAGQLQSVRGVGYRLVVLAVEPPAPRRGRGRGRSDLGDVGDLGASQIHPNPAHS